MPVYDDGDDGNYPLLGDLVPWPLLLITFGAAMAVLVIETWVGRQAGNDWWQAVTRNLEKPVYTAILCVIAGNTVRLAKEGIMWLAKEKARHEARVAARVAAEVTAQVTAEFETRIAAEIAAQVGSERDKRDKAWVEWLKSQNITPPETPPQLSER